ncbi:DNA recombination protein RmuC [Sphingobacterium sp. SYP-B4668]|uniref:DNA recombination protein RmuC n=1 Tax=Sphingobacterium sp. SYP-B4668 TaxID=2996035 RepID=UPI0022DD667B|nr:DNA recombination protein RmuC [Sphingobacterium sp. SYP-B4668]
MEWIFGVVVILLICCVIFLLIKYKEGVSKRVYEDLRVDKDELALELARSQQREEGLIGERADLKEDLDKERAQRLRIELTLENTNAYLQAQQEKLEFQKKEVEETKNKFNLEFQHIANKILEEKTQKFTEVNHRSINQLLDPLKDKIKAFEEKVERTYQHESAERNVLKGVVEQLMQQSVQIKNEANNLTRALKGDSKKQGNWGEVILERVLERSGLVKGQEYRLQASLVDGDGRRMQPDAIIDLPDEKHLVVDAKVSLVAYEKWVNAVSDEEQHTFAKQHVQSVENHVRELSAKNYHELYQIQSPDFVLLFMPIESALSMSVREKPDLFSDAWDRKVVIVSPSTLLATLRTIASVWKQERQNRNVLEIAREAGALYDKFVGFMQDMQLVENQIQRALERHQDATKKLGSGAGNIIKRVENLKDLGAKANKQIDQKYLDNIE